MIDQIAAFGVLGGVLGVVDTVPYVRDIARRSTVPHRGSWLIWAMLAIVALESQRADGARWSLVPLAIQAAGTTLVFVLSIRLGCGGLSRTDAALIALAGAGVVGWQISAEPMIATTCVIVADLLAALMMLPKAWRDPHSETSSTFALAGLGGASMIGAVGAASVSLLLYPVYFMLVNAGLAGLIGYRRAVLATEARQRTSGGDRGPVRLL